MYCIFHEIDHDGCGSAALLKLKYPELVLIGTDYKTPVPWAKMTPGESVFIVDFSYSIEDMRRLNSEYRLFWFDHHDTALNRMAAAGLTLAGLQRPEGAASIQLVYEFLQSPLQNDFSTHTPWDGTYPEIVKHIAAWDLWDHTDPLTTQIHYGLRLENTDPENVPLWRALVSNQGGLVNEVAARGKDIHSFLKQDYLDYTKQAAIHGILPYRDRAGGWHSLRVIAANRGLTGSPLLEHLYDPTKHDAIMVFYYQKTAWRCSLYIGPDKHDQVDLGEVAEFYQGGGHKVAAGMSLEYPPFGTPRSVGRQLD